jgi:hypothetical protein
MGAARNFMDRAKSADVPQELSIVTVRHSYPLLAAAVSSPAFLCHPPTQSSRLMRATGTRKTSSPPLRRDVALAHLLLNGIW